MDTKDFKNIVGELSPGKPATIRFYGKITEESASRFSNEFDYAESVKPSLIRILINCEGGSVLHGMSAYSTIQNSTVTTECINEGMAASMGSVLWAAGNRSLMRDYSILMIHNPFLPGADNEMSDMVQAFTKQIKTIYRKRFGLSEAHIESIMSGQAGKDGTFFDAESAVRAGIIPIENILHTSKQLCERVRDQLSGIEDYSAIQDMMARISAEAGLSVLENKPSVNSSPNLKQTNNNEQMSDAKTISPEYSAVAASLGMKDNFEVKDVMARISELVAVEAQLKEREKSLSDAQTVIAGKDATIKNLQKDNSDLTASLKTYKDKEESDRKAKVEQLVEAAVTEGKIEQGAKQTWIDMAEANYGLAESILASIPTREQISKEIANDPANVQAAADATKSAEEKMAEKVNAVVGENFKFKTIE